MVNKRTFSISGIDNILNKEYQGGNKEQSKIILDNKYNASQKESNYKSKSSQIENSVHTQKVQVVEMFELQSKKEHKYENTR